MSAGVLNQSQAIATRFGYVQTDVPPGMTLRAWRRARHPRRRRGMWHTIACALRTLLTPIFVPPPQQGQSRER